MTRKLKLGWGKPDEDDLFSHCKGKIFNQVFYKGFAMCWTYYKGEENEESCNITYLIYEVNGRMLTYYKKRMIKARNIKQDIDDGDVHQNIIWCRTNYGNIR